MSSEASQLTEIIRHGQIIWRWKLFLWGKHCLLYRKIKPSSIQPPFLAAQNEPNILGKAVSTGDISIAQKLDIVNDVCRF